MIDAKNTTSEFLDNLNVDSVLDLGCGQGKTSLRFARKGIKVMGVDKRNIEIKEANFQFIQKNIKEFEFKECFDLIISSLVLHFLNKEEALGIINKIKGCTNRGGYNFFVCMSELDDCLKERPENFYPKLDELKDLYKEWGIIKELQGFTDWEEHDGLEKHMHNLIFFLVKKY